MKRQRWKNQGPQQANNTVMTMGHRCLGQASAKRNGGADFEESFNHVSGEQLF